MSNSENVSNGAKRSRGRPRKLDRSEAADRAMELFWEHGYDSVGLSDLTAALGVKSPSIYATFGNKAGLFAAALDRYDALVGPSFAGAFDETSTAAFRRAILLSSAKLYTKDDVRRGCLVLDGARNSAEPEAISLATRQRTRFFEAMVDRLGELGDCSPLRSASALLVSMIGLSGAARSGMEKDMVTSTALVLADALNMHS